ncbi:hypothetical protein SDC9_69122 [bioreactor metagenome]|uniref:CBM20 domain-containing protein n=1 Tax=bioreactor metagenome TaxID=1076179 RepID=A0A644Y984_9ZZZZ
MSRLSIPVKRSLWWITLVLFTGSSLLSACQNSPFTSETKEQYPQAEVVFQVTLPSAIPQESKLMLEVVDDVTGLAFNPTRYEMTQQDDRTYFVKLDLVMGSAVKYRYVRQADVSTVEFDTHGNQVRFRLAEIKGPAIFQDSVSGWIDQPYVGTVGRITGQMFDASTNTPAQNLLICADGLQTTTASDGTFILEGAAVGTHNLVAYSMDGQFSSFQQGVVVSEGANTPVVAALSKRDKVNITFNVTLPKDFVTDLPMRLATNLQSLGNAYTDLSSGSTMVAANLPVFTKKSGSTYTLTLTLPAGVDLRYKITLGDGLWNSELTDQGAFVIRQLLVGSKDQTINVKVATFTTPGFAPISFDVIDAAGLPADEIVSLQFNPFGWFEPIPMLKSGEKEWKYTLYSPMNILGPVEYRFCRNASCESGSSVADTAQAFTPSSTEQNLVATVTQWSNLQNYQLSPDQLVTSSDGLLPRTDFLTGFELDSSYSPTLEAYAPSGLAKVVNAGSNIVIFTPTWTAIRNNPPILSSIPGKNINFGSYSNLSQQIETNGAQIAIFPQIKIDGNPINFWKSASKQDWNQSWFDRYQRYILNAADWAAQSGADSLILGDPSVKFADKSSQRWQALVSLARTKFSGKIIGIYTYPTNGQDSSWLSSVDQVYVLYSPTLSQESASTTQNLIEIITNDLSKGLYPKLKDLKKPVLIGINYPSAQNAFAGCTDDLGSCVNNWGTGTPDSDVQLRIYNAAVIASASQGWVNGFISRNFKLETALSDNSSSINGKPSMDILWFWYHFILNKTS